MSFPGATPVSATGSRLLPPMIGRILPSSVSNRRELWAWIRLLDQLASPRATRPRLVPRNATNRSAVSNGQEICLASTTGWRSPEGIATWWPRSPGPRRGRPLLRGSDAIDPPFRQRRGLSRSTRSQLANGEEVDIAEHALLFEYTCQACPAHRNQSGGQEYHAQLERDFAWSAMTPMELTVTPHQDDHSLYRACWADGDMLLSYIPEPWLDLIGFLIARRLLEQGYDVNRLLVVRLQGADYVLMRALLGAAAATPLVNVAAPVKRAAHAISRRGTAA